ncbi:MAG: hypothetical protein ABIV06_06505 [Thermoanaerobaculia bacterium]
MYEARNHPPLALPAFRRRLLVHVLAASGLLTGSVAFGMWGYMRFELLPWRDAFLNAAMLLGGMGPVDAPVTDDGKIFAGIYALYAGLVFLISASLLLAPVVHRWMHRFHWEAEDS